MSSFTELHRQYVLSLRHQSVSQQERLGYWMSTHLRVSGLYWGCGAMWLLGTLDSMPKDELVSFVRSCWNPSDGGFGGSPGHDSHLLYTLSAVQLLVLFEAEDQIDRAACAKWIASLQQPDGSFSGDKWGEVDTRFSYTALNCLSLLGHVDAINLESAIAFVLRCQNWDGGFGVAPGAESHAGQIFCCIGALSIAGALDRIDRDRVAWWLAERQLPSGGLNGRPEKKADVCYSWWVLSSLAMLDRLDWIDHDALSQFILLCQDAEDGGIADKPGNQPDVYHTFFGLTGLSLMGKGPVKLNPISATYALPHHVLERLGIRATT